MNGIKKNYKKIKYHGFTNLDLYVGVTFALYIGIAIWSRAGSTKEFYVAGEFLH
jgi:Na+(H+)/acetate symporter ActP